MIKADLHCHTIASTHAYSTVYEMVTYAKNNTELELIAITDHGPMLVDAPHIFHFQNLKAIPRVIDGVKVLRGVEANIVSLDGEIDLDTETLSRLDIVIASFHNPCGVTGTIEEHTNAYLNLIKNPYVDILGHSGTPNFFYDVDTVVKAAKEHNKIIEINNHSFVIRKGSIENCKLIAKKCKEYGVSVCVDSDAHISYELGIYDDALNMLKEIDFPKELIINTSVEKLISHLNKREGRIKIEF